MKKFAVRSDRPTPRPSTRSGSTGAALQAQSSRPEAVAQRKREDAANSSPRVQELLQLKERMDQGRGAAVPAGHGLVQRRVLPIGGGAPAAEKEFIDRRIAEFGQLNPAIQAIIDAPNVWLFVQLEREEERGDQRTLASYDATRGRTSIDIELIQGEDETPERLASDLLHELVLHAVPAYREHQAAVAGNRLPDFPQTDEEIEAAELAEHGDFDAWLDMATTAVRADGPWEFKQAVIADWLAHADESGLTQDDQDALYLLHQRDWDGLREEGYLPQED